MGSTNFESLHSELIRRVCEYLDETHPESLLSFARVSKTCYAIASGLLFRTIKVSVSDGQQLIQDVQRWETLLLRENGFRHVRRLILHCLEVGEVKGRQNGYLSLDPCERYSDDLGLRSCRDLYVHHRIPHDELVAITNEVWETLAHLMKRLTGLGDIFWACAIRFPDCLLRTLHADLRRCRLHDYAFDLSVKRGSIGPHAMTLADSPCLFSVGELNLAFDPLAWDYTRHQSRRIRETHLWLPADEVIDFSDVDNIPRWTGTELHQPSPLEIFHLNRPPAPETPLSFSTISWAVHGNFSALRVLRLDTVITNLEHLPPPHEFPILETLAFECSREARTEYWNTLLKFLPALPCLAALQIKHWARSVSFAPALNPHLRYLDFSTHVHLYGKSLKDDHIHQLADVCPELEELIIEIKRSRGNADEVARYRAIGRLRRLRNLTLHLDAAPPGLDSTVEYFDPNGELISHGTAIEPWFDAKDARTVNGPLRPYRQGHVYDALVNSAIDSGLARSIFHTVNGAKAEIKEAVLPLERVEIAASRGDDFQPAGRWSPRTPVMWPFLVALRRRWLVERDVRDDARDVLHVTELDQESRLDCWRSQAEYLKEQRKEYKFQDVFDMWQRVWPFEETASGQWETWSSLPLAVDLTNTVKKTEEI